ncbi:hypothetical protein [Pseudoalteromonas tunicata]|jgi:hypothetical protein|uniref:Orphan protein n=1 Tax=Pseudoalteromonas tunicata D2 TaxID=87626 RepID=A4C9D9_9GAMM|nr:hypothetical protein [Pseudoalteromonas tunicata]ATC93708.1 hypothetical protein PTUN_a1009 [Pseudoalteromonas tunicata]AXT29535.1 hypothetical protein D1819_00960 [Pseudoalteromonas tunicata]EAR29204.1 hypothetical protein PTD2_09169 [Pseudoalteromonas tunicata D2]
MTSIIKNSQLALAVTASIFSTLAIAAPLDQSEKDIQGLFSVDTQQAYTLYADSADQNLVWYVPKVGQIALSGASTSAPKPSFSVYARAPWTGIFSGQNLVHFGGAFNTSGDRGALLKLESEAHAQGLRISPAQAAKVTTKFLLTDLIVGNDGRINTQCDTEEWNGPNGLVLIPVCKALNSEGEWVNTDFLSKFRTATPRGNSTVSTYIPFQATSMPDWDFTVQEWMETGSNWDANIQAVAEWELTTVKKVRVARINIDWSRTFEQASTFFAIHNNACLEVEVGTFFKRLLDNQNGESGITVEYLQADGTYANEPTSEEQFIQTVEAVRKEMRDELFNEMRDFGQSQIGDVNREATAMYTMRANYEKLVFKRNETRYVSWNPGSSVTNASTNMNIQCVTGGFGTQVTWDMEDPACRSIAGQQ